MTLEEVVRLKMRQDNALVDGLWGILLTMETRRKSYSVLLKPIGKAEYVVDGKALEKPLEPHSKMLDAFYGLRQRA